MKVTISARWDERWVSHVCFPGITYPVKLLLSRRMLKSHLETAGAPCAAVSCHKHITPAHCSHRPCHLRVPNTGLQDPPGAVGTGTAPLPAASAAAADKRARRFSLTFTNRSCHSLLGVFWALTGKTSRPVSSGTNWSFPVLEAFLTKLFSLFIQFPNTGWTLQPLPQSGTNGLCFLFLFLWNLWKIKTFATASSCTNSPVSAGFV